MTLFTTMDLLTTVDGVTTSVVTIPGSLQYDNMTVQCVMSNNTDQPIYSNVARLQATIAYPTSDNTTSTSDECSGGGFPLLTALLVAAPIGLGLVVVVVKLKKS